MNRSSTAVAIVTGASGQDGSFLVERLLADGFEVHGVVRNSERERQFGAAHPGAVVHRGDISDRAAMAAIVEGVRPTHLFNLAGDSSVAGSWEDAAATTETIAGGTALLLQSVWDLMNSTRRPIRFLQASSAEMFGHAVAAPQTEKTALNPSNPYGAAKAFAHVLVGMFRRRGMFASSAILYNHESPRRPDTFVSRKITRGVASIALGLSDELVLGNLEARRDWGFAPDFVDAMVRILTADEPDDFVVATGVSHSVRAFAAAAFRHVGIDDWQGFVRLDAALVRSSDAEELVGDASKLAGLGWAPSVQFEELVALMVDSDLAQLSGATAPA